MSRAPATERVLERGRLPPGPRWPAAVQTVLWLGRPTHFIEECGRRYGDVFTLRLVFGPPTVVVGDPVLAERVLTLSPDVASAGEENEILAPLLGRHSLLLLDGPEHLRHRRLLSPYFRGEHVRRHGETIAAIARNEMDGWPLGREFPLLPRMRALTLEVILRVVFGVDDPRRLEQLRAAVRDVLRMGRSWMVLPWFQRDLGRLSPWSHFLSARARAYDLLMEEIGRRRVRTHDGGHLIDGLVGELSDEELKDELMTLLVAGHETTATSLSWCFEELLRRPELVERLQAELAAGSTRLLDAVVGETLRLRSVFRLVSRRLHAPVRLGPYEVPAGAAVGASLYHVHHRADLHPDPWTFDPDRFAGARKTGWIPFGGGARRCLGASFATSEMAAVVRTVISRAWLRPASARPEAVRMRAVMMVPSRGARVVLCERTG